MTSNKPENVIPTKDNTFVPWGHYKDIKSVVKAEYVLSYFYHWSIW